MSESQYLRLLQQLDQSTRATKKTKTAGTEVYLTRTVSTRTMPTRSMSTEHDAPGHTESATRVRHTTRMPFLVCSSALSGPCCAAHARTRSNAAGGTSRSSTAVLAGTLSCADEDGREMEMSRTRREAGRSGMDMDSRETGRSRCGSATSGAPKASAPRYAASCGAWTSSKASPSSSLPGAWCCSARS